MKIGVNIYPLRPRIAGGLEFYVRNLVQAMLRLDAGHSYYIITAPWNHREMDFGSGPYKKICIEDQPSKSGFIRHLNARFRGLHWDLYRCVMDLNLDVWFCPMMDLEPRHIDVPSVVTIADIQQEHYPQFFTQEELRHRELTRKPSCELATAVIAISEYVRKTLLDCYHLDESKIHRVYLAASPLYTPEKAREAWAAIVERHGLEKGYIFYPANTWPHKNHEMLLMALHVLKKRGISPTLVLTGAQVAAADFLSRLEQQLGLQNKVIHLGYVESRLFPGLYHGAACLVFPSLYEGFGIPLVEAMASGCAVACSNVCSIPEVVGDAACLFDPRKPDSIADALERILSSESLRRQLIEKGLRQAASFSWEIAAKETLAVFEKALSRKVSRPGVYRPPQDIIEGFFADGWAGPSMLIRRVELSRWRTLLLEGEVSGNCSPIRIKIQTDRDLITELKLENPGSFSRHIKLPSPGPDANLADLRIVASGSFVPKKIGLNQDTRRLSYRIMTLSLLDSEANSMSFQGKQ